MVNSSGRAPASPPQLSVWPVAIGGSAGIFLGIFVGDYAHFLRPFGQLYILLLEMAVYPYLICSLLHGLGSMSPAQAWRLFRSGWKFYLALWGMTFGLLILLAQGIPRALPTSWGADLEVKDSPSLLNVLIPSDLFTALARNYVPAVVLFCLF
jgi:proton glutamate symport protein